MSYTYTAHYHHMQQQQQQRRSNHTSNNHGGPGLMTTPQQHHSKHHPEDDVPTPIISNRVPTNADLPPILKLNIHNNNGSNGSNGRKKKYEARSLRQTTTTTTAASLTKTTNACTSTPQTIEPLFSSPNESPIVMTSPMSQLCELSYGTQTNQQHESLCVLRAMETTRMPVAGFGDAATSRINDVTALLLQLAMQTTLQVAPWVKNQLRRAILTQQQQQQDQQHDSFMNHSFFRSANNNNLFTATTRLQSATKNITPSMGRVRVHGIPNYGQTCFLNSVLQSLASLDCFSDYLEHLVQVQHQRRRQRLWLAMSSTTTSTNEKDPPLCETLLEILQQVNGMAPTGTRRRSRIDPRPILQAVGQQHSQFRARFTGAKVNCGEQQDSQEVLQAVMDLVVQDSCDNSGTTSSDPGCDREPSSSLLQSSIFPVDWCGASMQSGDIIGSNHSNGNIRSRQPSHTISLWEGLERKRRQKVASSPTPTVPKRVSSTKQTRTAAKTISHKPNYINNDNGSNVSPKSILPPLQNTSQGDDGDYNSCGSSSSSESESDNAAGLRTDTTVHVSPLPEEKKEESGDEEENYQHFEAFIPDDASEDELHPENLDDNKSHDFSWGTNRAGPLAVKDVEAAHDSSNRVFDDDGDDDDICSLSKAIQIIRTTTSSITPSPLSGWCASALMCRTCRRVRPLQNTPILDVPVVPAAVSQYVSASSRMHHPGDPPVKPGAREPPCRLEECLEDFSSIERVHDVECKNCTLQAAIREQESEQEWQEQTLRNLLQSRRAKTHAGSMGSSTDHVLNTMTDPQSSKEFKHLQEELDTIQSRLEILRKTDPDDDTPLPVLRDADIFGSPSGDSDSSNHIKLKRSDAFKCLLLSRLPAVLSIHVQRRYFDPMTGQESKTMQHVIFPEILDVAPYCAYGGAVRPEAPFAGTVHASPRPSADAAKLAAAAAAESQQPILYRLMAVIEHRGGAHSGHYVCFRRDPNSATNGWLWISDETVRPCDWTVVRQCQAYMLFYESM